MQQAGRRTSVGITYMQLRLASDYSCDIVCFILILLPAVHLISQLLTLPLMLSQQAPIHIQGRSCCQTQAPAIPSKLLLVHHCKTSLLLTLITVSQLIKCPDQIKEHATLVKSFC